MGTVAFVRGARTGLALGILGLVMACSTSADQTGSDTAANTAAACSPELFGRMLNEPIRPPRMIAGLDLAGGDAWTGLTLQDAERTLCQSAPIASEQQNQDQDPLTTTLQAGWGVNGNNVVQVDYNKVSRKIEAYQIHEGYRGTLDFASRPTSLSDPSKPNPFGSHRYSIGIGRPVLRDGQTWELNWKKACDPTRPDIMDCWEKQATEMLDALLYTFAPDLPSTQESCIREQTCLARSYSTGEAVFGARPLGIYFYVPSVLVPQPAPSTPGYIYGFTLKQTAFSHADMMLKLDGEGPVATARDIGDRAPRATCTMKIGMPFQQFMSDCVQVLRDPSANDFLAKKVLGNAQRSIVTAGTAAAGTWLLDVSGPNPNFSSERFDETTPPVTSHATELTFDVRSTGEVLNEYAADGQFTFAGTGSVLGEYARLTQQFLHAKMDPQLPRFSLGAPECLLPENADAATWRPARGCTGMEQFITPVDPSTTSDSNLRTVSVGASRALSLGIRTVLKPGDPSAVFCADPGKFNFCRGGEGELHGLMGPLWDTTRQQVVKVLGGGNEASLPAEARDTKVYVQLFTRALVKYLRAASQAPAPIELSRPAFDALAPSDADITIENVGGDAIVVKYLDKLEYRLLATSGNVQHITFR
jgi:hypothetical protein